MALTTVTTKDGEVFQGPIWVWRPQENWFSILWRDDEEVFSFDDIETAVTHGERIGVDVIGDVDEMERARKLLRRGREYGWEGYPEEEFDWE